MGLLHHDFEIPAGLTAHIPSVVAKNFYEYDPFIECTRKALRYAWDNKIIPAHGKHSTFRVEGIDRDVHTFRFNAENTHTEIRFGLGLNAVPMAYTRGIHALNQLGFDVVMMVQPFMGREKGGADIFPTVINEFYTSRDLDIDRGHDETDRIMVAHSISGLSRILNATDPEKEKKYNRRYIGALDVAPFLGMAGANWEFHPRYRRILECQAAFTPNKKPSETIGGQLHHQLMVLAGEPQLFSSIDDPTYSQMLEYDNLAEETLQAVAAREPTLLPTCTIVPSSDSIACPKRGTKAANIMGSHVHATDAWHNPFIENPLRSISRLVIVAQKFKAIKMQKELGLDTSLAQELGNSPRLTT